MHNEAIIRKINSYKEPITVEKFIEISLYGKDGYYKDTNIIGSSGDFITSPEISQLFGEILGLYILDYWQESINKKFNLIELGPGNGTLLSDILRVTEKFKDFKKATKVNLVEKNINLIKKQKNNLIKLNFKISEMIWSRNFIKTYDKPVIIFANEFFDCLPIRQFYKKNEFWYEKMVKYIEVNNTLRLTEAKVEDENTLKKIDTYNPLNLLEISESREKYFIKICKHILKVGGMMIAVDYGYLDKPTNFTLQSVYNNKYSNVFDNIGHQDITSLVDFKSLILIAKKNNLKVNIIANQRDFLIQNGIIQRSEKILLNCKQSQKEIIESGLNRLINKDNMGSAFKVLVISK